LPLLTAHVSDTLTALPAGGGPDGCGGSATSCHYSTESEELMPAQNKMNNIKFYKK